MRTVRGVLAVGIVLVANQTIWGVEARPPQDTVFRSTATSPAERLVRQALGAELAGDNDGRCALLAEALKADPACHAARWQTGNVLIAGKWLSPSDVARKYVADRDLAEYRRRRDAAATAGLFARSGVLNSAAGTFVGRESVQATLAEHYRSDALSAAGIAAHADLARWCRSKRLVDEERAHWTQVLLADPTNREAESRLGMKSYLGGLFTFAQIDAIKKQRALEEKQLSQWKGTVHRWRSAIDSGSAADRERTVDEMVKTDDAAVIPALEWGCDSDGAKPPAKGDDASRFQRQAVALLGRIPTQRATYSLVRRAVLSSRAELRGVAADELRKRNLYDFVPLLVDGLANPIQWESAIAFEPSTGVTTSNAIFSQDGHGVDRQMRFAGSTAGGSNARRVYVNDAGQLLGIEQGDLFPRPDAAVVSESVAAQVAEQNARIDALDRRISFVLERVSGVSPAAGAMPPDDSAAIPDVAVESSPLTTADFWWAWWDKYNENYTPYKQVEITQYTTSTYTPGASTPVMQCSCFPAGTPVMTLTGPLAIETLRIGDRVLAQDPDSGELAYKPVLGTTIRPPAELLEVSTSQGALRLTRGHALWIDGKGWRMAKEAEAGDHAHCLGGATVIGSIAEQPAEAVYNLHVADFHTYFVGREQILVHDNTTRLPTSATVPGLMTSRTP